jgi:hypothetical protein
MRQFLTVLPIAVAMSFATWQQAASFHEEVAAEIENAFSLDVVITASKIIRREIELAVVMAAVLRNS